MAHSGTRPPRHGGGGGCELFHSLRGGGPHPALAAAGDPAACLRPLFRLRLRLCRPLQGEVALHLAAGSHQHRPRRDGAGSDALGARLRAFGAEPLRHVLLRQDHDRALLAAADRVLVGPRIAYRHFRYTRTLHHAKEGDSTPTLVVGRTADADVLLRGIESGAVTKIRPVGILSPSLADRGQAIRGVSVLGGPDDIESVITDLRNRGTNVTRLVLTPSALAPEAKPETILMRARRLGLATSRLPSLDDGGEALRLAPVNVADLLLRPRVKIDYRRLESFVRGKSIIVTGGGGSIGAEICDRIVTFGVARLLVIENSEPALHAVLEMLATRQSAATIE